MEPEEEPSVTAVREVLEEAGVMGKLGRCLGVFEVSLTVLTNLDMANLFVFQNQDHMHRTEVFVMTVTKELEEWEDSRSIGRKRQWFSIDDALTQLALHKPTQRHYLMQLRHSKNNSNVNSTTTTNSPTTAAPTTA